MLKNALILLKIVKIAQLWGLCSKTSH